MLKCLLQSLAGFAVVVLAGASSASGVSTSGGDAVAALSQRLASFDTLTARFEQRLYGGPQGAVESSGYLAVARPSAFRWETEQPYPQIVVTQEDAVWVYDPDLEQVTVRPLEEAMADTPAGLLTGNGNSIAESFRVTQVVDEDQEEFLLRPVAEDSLYSVLLIRFADGVLRGLEITDHLGQMTQVEFSDVIAGAELPESTFEVELPPETDIIGGSGGVE